MLLTLLPTVLAVLDIRLAASEVDYFLRAAVQIAPGPRSNCAPSAEYSCAGPVLRLRLHYNDRLREFQSVGIKMAKAVHRLQGQKVRTELVIEAVEPDFPDLNQLRVYFPLRPGKPVHSFVYHMEKQQAKLAFKSLPQLLPVFLYESMLPNSSRLISVVVGQPLKSGGKARLKGKARPKGRGAGQPVRTVLTKGEWR